MKIRKSTEIIKSSPDRVHDDDSKWAHKGYARLANLQYDKQLAFKKERIQRLLTKEGLDGIEVEDVIASPLQKHYRNEVVFPVLKVNGQIEIGFYEPRTTNFIPLNNFVTTNSDIEKVLFGVRDILRELDVSVYDPDTNTGFVRDIDVRRSETNDGMIITLVTHNKDDVKLLELSGLITEKLHNVNGIVLNFNPHKTNEIFGKENIPVWGNDFIEDEINGVSFKISPKSFFQPNGGQLKTIKTLEAADLQADDDLIDAYCGVGSFCLIAADKVKSVRGVDSERTAIEDARFNTKKNKVENANFYIDNADQVMNRLAKNNENASVIIATAPKKGFIEASVKMQPREFIYLSFNPDTLVHELKLFKQNGYETKAIKPIDVAPQTPDMMCICRLDKENLK